MSTYYEFYTGILRQDGKIEAIGPYVRRDGAYRLEPILIRSRSFINIDEFSAWDVPVEKLIGEQKEFFTTGSREDETVRHSLAWYIPYTEIRTKADSGLVRGNVTLKELDYIAKNDYDPDCLWDVSVMSAAAAAEMDPEMRKQYGHIAYIDYNSTGYLCSLLIHAADPMCCGEKEEDLVFIVRIS